MRVTKIKRLKGYGVFRDYSWSNDLSDFKRFNLIYGWNGSGKTLLSNVFRALEEQKELEKCDDVKIELDDGSTISKGEFESKGKTLRTKVFNRDYIVSNVFNGSNTLEHIFFLGKESIEKQNKIIGKKNSLIEQNNLLSKKNTEHTTLIRGFDTFKSQSAKNIKDEFLGYNASAYSNYDKRRFGAKIDELIKDGYKQESNDRELIESINVTFAKCSPLLSENSIDQEFVNEVVALCGKSIVAETIKKLEDNLDIHHWVRDGLKLHRKHHEETECLYCGQRLPESRITTLEKHFNDEQEQLSQDIDGKIHIIEHHLEWLRDIDPPDSSKIYPQLRGEYSDGRDRLIETIRVSKELLSALKQNLETKSANPFSQLPVKEQAVVNIEGAIVDINNIISKHNENVTKHSETVKQAISELEKYRVHQYIEQYQNFETKINDLSKVISNRSTTIATESREIKVLEQEIVQHQKPAEELNKELGSYLGHSELRFEVKETGYQIFRGEELATSISEGERTAIAFLYFLKTLEDKDFDISNGIVVIDDPMSSLDSNNLYSAFSYMKERLYKKKTHKIGQLFLLTHNFQLFRLAKRWLDYFERNRNKKSFVRKETSLSMLKVQIINDSRISVLSSLDPLLEDYESDYHYLFSLVYKTSKEAELENVNIEYSHYYQMPNIARRLLETYLGFRMPTKDDLHEKLNCIEYDENQKNAIYRFCNTHSHKTAFGEPEHDAYLLSQTTKIMRYLMDFIRETDAEHFRQMESVVLVNNKGT